MANEEQKGSGIIGACSHNGSALAMCFLAHFGDSPTMMKIQAQGAKGNAVNRPVRWDNMAVLSYVGGARIARETKGSTIVHLVEADGVTLATWTATNMVSLQSEHDAEHGTGNHSATKQFFENESDQATDPFTIAYA